jgi:hypothetical protein
VIGMQWRASTEAEKQKHKATCLRRRPHNEQKALDLDNTSKQGPLSDPYYFGTPSSRSLLSFWDLLSDSPVGRVQEIAQNPLRLSVRFLGFIVVILKNFKNRFSHTPSRFSKELNITAYATTSSLSVCP